MDRGGVMTTVTVISCSDAALEDAAEDRAGTVLREGLASLGFQVSDPQIVPCDTSLITSALVDAFHGGARVAITAGASGLLPQDVAVEATMPLVEFEIPGIMEEIRRRGAEKTPLSLLSRGVAGVVELPGLPRSLVVNAPGSRGGARDTLAVLGPMLERIVASLDGVGHDR